MQLVAHLGGAEIDEMRLHIGCRQPRIGAEESAGIAGAHGERALAVERIAQADAELAHHAGDVVVERDRPRAAIDQAGLQMVLQILADAVQIVHHRDAEALQQRRRARRRRAAELRRCDGAGGEDDLAVGARAPSLALMLEHDADGFAASNSTRVGQRGGDHAQIGPLARRAQIADRRAAAPAAPRRGLEIAGAFLTRAVEIVVARNAGLLGRRR